MKKWVILLLTIFLFSCTGVPQTKVTVIKIIPNKKVSGWGCNLPVWTLVESEQGKRVRLCGDYGDVGETFTANKGLF